LNFAGFDDAVLPPRKQIGLQRTEEMKLMYGEAAPMILGMETAVQLSFDRNCDLKQPKLWPNIPLKL
jgi:gem associated protein 8